MMHTRSFPHTHEYKGYHLRYGHPLPFGASHVPQGVNFSVFSAHATSCTLVLFREGEDIPFVEIPFPDEFRIGHIFAMMVFGLNYKDIEYGFRMDGPHDRSKGHRFDPEKILMDPFARDVRDRSAWLVPKAPGEVYPFRSRMVREDFNWEHDRPLKKSESELIIYELHVRGFTRHPRSGVEFPGTYQGMIEKIGYFRDLGINVIEAMPIFEFDEMENTRTNPLTGERLCNYWGYSPISFFAPKADYSSCAHAKGEIHELRRLIRNLHREGIEFWMDVVYNHTAEGGEEGPTFSLRGIDNRTYYMTRTDGSYQDFTGCGNTVNCNHPVVREFVLESLRHWAAEYHVDGFRFDLASVLGRNVHGAPLADPPLLEQLAFDPLLANCNLVAEAWDAAGLYQVGNFPSYRRWMEWNGRYRDAARKFLIGSPGMTGEMVQRIMGSPDLYKASGRKPTASVNFITCHDGFTLRDLFTYSEKRNLENGEGNRDGSDENLSWNCGVEGETDDPAINALRMRMQKNAFALLLVSQGVPLLSMGDEVGRTQRGNNNAYCHDTEWNWFDWEKIDKYAELLRFVRGMIAFRKAKPILHCPEWLTERDCVASGYADISWHGIEPWKPDWGEESRSIAFLLCGLHAKALGGETEFIYCIFNMFWESLSFSLPTLPHGLRWFRFADTGLESPEDIAMLGEEPVLPDQKSYIVRERSAVILLGRS